MYFSSINYSDLLLVQTHLNILQQTHRPSPSLHHTLASRLENWLQSMNTPPIVDPDLVQMEFDPSWALFDATNDRLATESFYQQLNINQNMNEGNGDLQTTTNNGIGAQGSQDFDTSKTWAGHENVVWPSNLLRLFGTADYQPSKQRY